jgi:hypothetical protein
VSELIYLATIVDTSNREEQTTIAARSHGELEAKVQAWFDAEGIDEDGAEDAYEIVNRLARL